MSLKAVAVISLCLAVLWADDPQLKRRAPLPPNGTTEYRLEQGQRIFCKFLNTVSISNSEPGDRVYLQTVFPVVVSNHTVIPAGTYIDGKVTESRRTAHSKAQAELLIKLGRLTLPNRDPRHLDACFGRMTAAFSTRGTGVVIVPGTTVDVVLEDPILFPVVEVRNH